MTSYLMIYKMLEEGLDDTARPKLYTWQFHWIDSKHKNA